MSKHDATDEIVKRGDGHEPVSTSRRGVLAGIAGLGALKTTETETANALQTSLSFGGSYSGQAGTGLRVTETTTDGSFTTGLYAGQNSSSGAGLFGEAKASDGRNYGVFGRSGSSNGAGVTGRATNTTGNTVGLLGVADSARGTGLAGDARATSGPAYGLRGRTQSPDGVGVYGRAFASSGVTYGVQGEADSSSGFGLYSADDAKVEGDLIVNGTKHFAQAVETPSGPCEVRYNAVEAGKAHTEVTDTADVENGRAVVDLPEHFGMVTSEAVDLTVQVTPFAADPVRPQVVDCSVERLVVEDFGDSPDDYTISYTVKGVREGFEDQPVVH